MGAFACGCAGLLAAAGVGDPTSGATLMAECLAGLPNSPNPSERASGATPI